MRGQCLSDLIYLDQLFNSDHTYNVSFKQDSEAERGTGLLKLTHEQSYSRELKMMLKDFEIQNFIVPDFTDVLLFVQSRYQIDPILAERLTIEWLAEYCHKLSLFYLSQYSRHEMQMHREFGNRTSPSYDLYDSVDTDLPYVLEEHQSFVGQETERLSRLQDKLERELHGKSINPFAWVLEQIGLEHSGKIPPRMQLEWDLNAYWFNREIDNAPELISHLRTLEYTEYLKTPHWRRVRASLIMIRQAICQHGDCYSSGESYFGDWEAELHVHHMSYQNRGFERYADLGLLCKIHHNLWHSDRSKLGKPSFKLVGYYSEQS